jgi:hypothetical protein
MGFLSLVPSLCGSVGGTTLIYNYDFAPMIWVLELPLKGLLHKEIWLPKTTKYYTHFIK